MANDSSLGSAAETFDFDTQSGVMHLLASVRASGISAAEKNELRDLIFLYSNGGHDQSVRNNLEQKLTQYSVVAVPKPKTFTPPKIHEFGTSRPSPAFKAAPVQVTEKQVEETSQPEPVVVNSAPQREAAPVPVVDQESVAHDIPVNLPQASHAPEVKVNEQTEPPVEVPAALPVVNAAPETDNLQRIKEIKSLVNEKVGNPVNLVDINNEVGREYMAALLDAMKKINSGSSAASAMQRLETAFTSVEETLKKHDSAESTKLTIEPAVAAAPVEHVVPEAPAPAEVLPEVPVQAPAAPASQPETSSIAPAKFSPISSEQTQSIESESKMDDRALVQVAQSEKVASAPHTDPVPATTTPAPAPVTQSSVPPAEPEQVPGSAWGPATDTFDDHEPTAAAQNQQQVAAPARYKSAPLADSETKLRTPEDLPTASALETSSVSGDPLFTKQVDDGLNQLLSDWILFKKSGLFGTGAKGMSHPLYLKIKDLQIPLLLAGRFEGATQEVKQSVTDYMNGWRYEQGIIYEQGETFDHYLRRVIRHILDLQKNL